MLHAAPCIPSRVKLRISIFEHLSHHYLMVVGYISKFPTVKKPSYQPHVTWLVSSGQSLQNIGFQQEWTQSDQEAQFVLREFRAFEAAGVTFKPAIIPSKEWFYESQGQNGKEHHGKGKGDLVYNRAEKCSCYRNRLKLITTIQKICNFMM